MLRQIELKQRIFRKNFLPQFVEVNRVVDRVTSATRRCLEHGVERLIRRRQFPRDQSQLLSELLERAERTQERGLSQTLQCAVVVAIEWLQHASQFEFL